MSFVRLLVVVILVIQSSAQPNPNPSPHPFPEPSPHHPPETEPIPSPTTPPLSPSPEPSPHHSPVPEPEPHHPPETVPIPSPTTPPHQPSPSPYNPPTSTPEPSPHSIAPLPSSIPEPVHTPTTPTTPVHTPTAPVHTPTATPTTPTTPTPPLIPDYIFEEIQFNEPRPPGRSGATLGITSDNSTVVLVGGNDDTDVWKLTLNDQTWKKTQINRINTTRSCSTQAPDSQLIYIYGGMRYDSPVHELITYNPNNDEVSDTGPVNITYPYEVSGCASDGDSFYAFGGINGQTCENSIYVYEKDKPWVVHTFQPDRPTVPEPRTGASVSLYNDNLIVIGGWCPPNNYFDLRVYRFSFSTLSWSVDESELPRVAGLSYHTANIVGDHLYLLGGIYGPQNEKHNTTYIYDLLKEEWKILNHSGSGPSPRLSMSSLALFNRIIFFGGEDSLQQTKRNVVQTKYNDTYQLVLELNCLGKKCTNCVDANGCGWCNDNSENFQCVAGNTTSYVKQGGCSRDLVNDIYQCPEDGLQSWAIALIVIGGVVVIGVIVFAIMKLRSQRSEYDTLPN